MAYQWLINKVKKSNKKIIKIKINKQTSKEITELINATHIVNTVFTDLEHTENYRKNSNKIAFFKYRI